MHIYTIEVLFCVEFSIGFTSCTTGKWNEFTKFSGVIQIMSVEYTPICPFLFRSCLWSNMIAAPSRPYFLYYRVPQLHNKYRFKCVMAFVNKEKKLIKSCIWQPTLQRKKWYKASWIWWFTATALDTELSTRPHWPVALHPLDTNHLVRL